MGDALGRRAASAIGPPRQRLRRRWAWGPRRASSGADSGASCAAGGEMRPSGRRPRIGAPRIGAARSGRCPIRVPDVSCRSRLRAENSHINKSRGHPYRFARFPIGPTLRGRTRGPKRGVPAYRTRQVFRPHPSAFALHDDAIVTNYRLGQAGASSQPHFGASGAAPAGTGGNARILGEGAGRCGRRMGTGARPTARPARAPPPFALSHRSGIATAFEVTACGAARGGGPPGARAMRVIGASNRAASASRRAASSRLASACATSAIRASLSPTSGRNSDGIRARSRRHCARSRRSPGARTRRRSNKNTRMFVTLNIRHMTT